MDQKQIEALVQQVMSKLNVQATGNGQNFTASLNPTEAKPYDAGSSNQSSGSVELCSMDLGSPEAKEWIGVQNPNKLDVLKAFKGNTGARVGSGRAGVRPRTMSLIRFLADHSRSKDTVLKEVPKEWVEKHGLLEVQSEAKDKDQYLTRPDMGRVLSAESVELIKKNCATSPDVQVIVCDGLSTDAVLANYDEVLPPLMKGLESTGLKIGKPIFSRYGRVKLEDHIGELVGAKAVVMLVGERPGLGQSESLSCYAVYNPTVKDTVEADRTCISNIHKAGTPPVEAAAVIVDLVKKMIDNKASGISLANISK